MVCHDVLGSGTEGDVLIPVLCNDGDEGLEGLHGFRRTALVFALTVVHGSVSLADGRQDGGELGKTEGDEADEQDGGDGVRVVADEDRGALFDGLHVVSFVLCSLSIHIQCTPLLEVGSGYSHMYSA